MSRVDETLSPSWRVPPRSADDRVVAGVAAGVARELGLDPFPVRAAFVVLGLAGGLGLVLYGVAWLLMDLFADTSPDASPPVPKGANGAERLAGFGAVVAGLLLLARWADVGFVDSLVWPVALFAAGVSIAHERGVDPLGVAESDRAALVLRLGAGLLLFLAGVVLAVSLNFSLRELGATVVVLAMVLAGMGLVVGPWIEGLVKDLDEERRARIRSDERAAMAAHLHDSVLQTLTLIQRRVDDPGVVHLARRQERELRSWLYGRRTEDGEASFASRLEAELAEVEELHAVPVEVVVVGNGPIDEARRALLAATREAVINASVHSGASRVDVFAEIRDEAVDVFVRDTGRGFDPSAVAGDRRGISESIRGRLERVGGRVAVVSQPGKGTEIEMHLGGEPR